MIPSGMRNTLASIAHRVRSGLSEQLKRLAQPGRSQALASKAASHPKGLVMRKMPAFSALLEEAQTPKSIRPHASVTSQVSAPREADTAVAHSPQGRPSPVTRYVEYTVKPGDTLWRLGVKKFAVDPDRLARENSVSDPSRIRPGQRLRIPVRTFSVEQRVVASWYGHEHHGKPMANGEPFNMHAATIAHKELPLGTRVELSNPETGQKVQAVVTDRGPFIEGRDVDLSYGLARRLNMVEKGVGQLLMRVLA